MDLRIEDILPHRYPFLLVDRVTRIAADELATGYKNVSYNEPFFQGHFPDMPIMPGVLILEALAQLSAILAIQSARASGLEGADTALVMLFAGIEKARFKRQVVPGDQLLLKSCMSPPRHQLWQFQTEARVNDDLACKAVLIGSVQTIKK